MEDLDKYYKEEYEEYLKTGKTPDEWDEEEPDEGLSLEEFLRFFGIPEEDISKMVEENEED